MDFSTVSNQIERTKQRIKNIDNISPEKVKETIEAETLGKEIVVNVKKEKANTNSTPLDKQKFEELVYEYEKSSVDDLQVGNFVRYKFKNLADGTIKYVWGGLLIFKSPEFIRLKNVSCGKSWSVFYSKPERRYVFYQKKKQTLEPDGLYVNLKTASTEGLLSVVVDRGEYESLENAAKLAKKNHVKKSLAR